jgi:hypothetical protein
MRNVFKKVLLEGRGAGGRVIYSEGARTAAASTPLGPRARPAPMPRAAHSVEAKAVVRIEVAVRPRPCLGCDVGLVLRIAPLRRGVLPR